MTDPTIPDTLTAAAERARHLPEGGLTAYANRMRESHQRLANGWCSCDNPLCPARYLLDHIDTLVQSYNLKVQDLAQETARNAAASAPAVDREALESLVAEAIDCATPIGRPASPDDLDAQTTAVLDDLTTAIDAAVDTDPLKLRDALLAILRHCEMAEDSWDLASHPGPRPGAPPPLTMPDGAWLPTDGIRNLIARELGEGADRGSR